MLAPFRKTSRSSLLCCLIATLIVFTLAANMAAFAAVNGAIFTTTSNGTKVNGNLYASKADVYLNGGPQNTKDPGLVPDGNYYFQVTDPSGAKLLSLDDISCRQVVVSGGRIIGVPSDYGTPPTGTVGGCDHQLGTFNTANGEQPVQLCNPDPTKCPTDFADTDNPGGEYKVWLTPVCAGNLVPGQDCYDATNAALQCHSDGECWGFPDSSSKTDNFKVQPPPPPPPPPCPDANNPACNTPPPPDSLVACKFWDKDDDGLNVGSDILLSGWTITATPDSGNSVQLSINGGAAGAAASGTTDVTGCTTFTVTGWTANNATTVASVTLNETLQPNWNQVAPLHGTYIGGTGGSITVTGCNFTYPPGIPACTSTSDVPLIADGSTTLAPDFGNTGLDLTVSKTATPAFTRTYTWSISKKVDKTLIETTGTTATFNYEVDVNETNVTDSAWQVSGTITVANPNSFDVTGVNVADVVDDGGSCTITDPHPGNDTVPAGGSLALPYLCTYLSQPAYTAAHNTATATWNAATFNTPDGSASYQATFQFNDGVTAGNPTLVNKTVTPTDSFNGGSAVNLCTLAASTPCTLTATDTTPYTSQAYKYSRSITVKPGCFTYNNTATVVQDTLPYPTASASVEVCGPAKTGALTMGFWQNKNGQTIILNYSGANCQVLKTWLNGYHPFSDLTATACGSSPSLGAKSASGVLGYVYNVVKAATCSGPSTSPCNAMLKAQMLATALDVYFSDAIGLGGNRIGAPAVIANAGGIGTVSIDLTNICNMIDGSGGTATCSGTFSNVASLFGVTKCDTVSAMLTYQNTSDPAVDAGAVWYGNVKANQVGAKNAFDAINNQVAFGCP